MIVSKKITIIIIWCTQHDFWDFSILEQGSFLYARRQILPYKDSPRTERIKTFVMVVDP